MLLLAVSLGSESNPAGVSAFLFLRMFQAFESTLKSWEDKQKCEFPRAPPQPPMSSQPEIVSEEEALLISEFGQAAGALIHR